MSKINMADPFFTEEDRVKIHIGIDEILSGILSMGHNVRAFEREFSELIRVPHAVAMNACTSALEAALIGLGVREGDEVIVPCETFIATGMAVHLVGGKPVFAEISERTFCLDFDDVQKRITPRTKGIIIVYMGGLIPDDILKFRNLCDDHGLFLVEDAAHAPGASLQGKLAGSFGHAGCFSFYPTKVITAGEGGMLTTEDERLAEFARSFQHRGRDFTAPNEQYNQIGRNVRMTEMAALMGRIQLEHLHEYLAERCRVMRIYRQELKNDQRVSLVIPDDESASAYWKIPLIFDDKYDRCFITKELKKAGISVDWSYQPPLHLQPIFQKNYKTKVGHLPKSEHLLSHHICLPCHPRISDQDAVYVAKNIKSILDKLDFVQ
ncbi:MAG: DegT/DnrJ/EryC1/StrS family aminotransferase [Symploca sp. SIO1B1]|nr:DegT/DnrJ/EryC1/StrS family aminotransferase [Symploca sp. SIO1B1]